MKRGRERAGWRKLLYSVWLAVIPFLVQALLLTILRPLSNLGPDIGNIGFFAPLLSSIVGFVFVTRLMTGIQKIMVGFVYFPVMYLLLMFFSLGFIGRVYGDWL